MRQIIIARKDLNMSPGKLAAQVAHASWAFLSTQIRDEPPWKEHEIYHVDVTIPIDVYNDWFCGIFTKTICEAKNINHLMKAVGIAENLGLRDGQDYFLIRDACLTELEPEEIGEDGTPRTLTCIGFRPLDDETAWKISKKYQLYK